MNIIRLIATRALPEKHFHFSNGPLDVLDHAGKEKTYGGKLCIDLTGFSFLTDYNIDLSNFNSEKIVKEYNELAGIEEQYLKKNIPVIILFIKKKINPEILLKKLNDKNLQYPANIFIIADEVTQKFNVYHKIWHYACNFDPGLDTYFLKNNKILIDCTTKQRNDPSPEMALSNPETIQTIDNKWKQLGLGNFLSSPSTPFIQADNKKS
jgi:4-hydroxy-3-polyprenylbenzoate decarboxylase